MKNKILLYSLLFVFTTLKISFLSGQQIAQQSGRTISHADEPEYLWKNEAFGAYPKGSELVEKRNANTKHFQNPDGTVTAHVATGDIHYMENGEWKTIFHTIVSSSTGFENTTNTFKTYYPATSGGQIKTILSNGKTVKDMIGMRMYYEVNGQALQVQHIQEKQGNIHFNELTYQGAYGNGIDLRLTQNTTQRKMDYIIQNSSVLANIPSGAQFLIFEEKAELPNGWTAQLINNEILLTDESGNIQARYNKPVFSDTPEHLHEHDSDHDHHHHQHIEREIVGQYEISQTGRIITIKTKVPLTWLTSSERNFPVIIDPTFDATIPNTANWTGSIRSNNYAGAFNSLNSNDFIRLGRTGTGNDFPAYHGWAKFDVSGVPNTCITSAILHYYIYSNATTGSTCSVYGNVRHMANDPSAVTDANRLTDIRDGDIYSNHEFAIMGTANNVWRSVGINNYINHLITAVPTGIFSVGMHIFSGRNEHLDCYLDIRGRSNANKPYLRITYTAPPPDPGFGNFMWNVAGYNGSNIDLTGINYYGYYTQNTGSTTDFGFNTQDVTNSGWNNALSPSSSATWNGCTLPNDHFTFVHKRRGFPCGTYQLTLNNWDDATRVYINGNPAPVWSCADWSGAGTCTGTIGVYGLDANSTVEVRTAEGTGGANASLSITPVVSTLALSGNSRTCPVSGNQWTHFYTNPDGRYLASVRGTTAASNLGNVTVTAYDDVNPLNVPACDDPGYITSVMERHWVITPTLDGAAEVRLPYYGEELNQLTSVANANSNPDDNVAGQASVRLSKYSGGAFPASVNVNNNALDNCPASGGTGNTTIHNNSGVGTVTGVTVPGGEISVLYSQYTIAGFSEFWLHGSIITSPLSVNLESFNAHCEDNHVRIKWTTASEQNSDYFVLERSRDGYTWTAVTTADGAGTTNSPNNYAVTDIANGEVYYRLKQFDFDGTQETFGPIHVHCGNAGNASLTVYPNPNNGTFTVAVNTDEALGESTIFVHDMNGKIVAVRDLNILSGTNTVHFENSDLMKGTYIVSIKERENKILVPVKLIIQ